MVLNYPPNLTSLINENIKCVLIVFFVIWKYARETHQYFPTLVDGRGGKWSAILAEGLTPKDSRLEPMTSP